MCIVFSMRGARKGRDKKNRATFKQPRGLLFDARSVRAWAIKEK